MVDPSEVQIPDDWEQMSDECQIELAEKLRGHKPSGIIEAHAILFDELLSGDCEVGPLSG